MKNYFILAALLCVFHSAHAQTPLKTINYQALIVDPAAIELPGNAVQAQLFLNKEVWVKFGIYAGTTLQFEELHKTKTDGYGLINLEIGAGENTVADGTFGSINWGASLMKLMTQVSFNQGAKYTEVSNRGLNYLPYAHFSEEAGRLSGILSVTSGGTGATSAPAARAKLGLGNVDNTADVDKPVSGLVLAELNNKESLVNKSNSILLDSSSSEKYPSVKAVKTYVDNRTATANVANQAKSANLAAKATTLETPRTINGVPFDGSSNISIPIDAEVLTGNIPITKGGTGAVTASSARTNLGLKIGVDVQAPLVAGTDYQRPLIAGTDYQVPLVGGVDYQRPLVSGTDYQTPITAGSGISISSGSVAATGLTTANLSAIAGITNGQLASSTFTLGSTSVALGGTYRNVAGLTVVSPVLTGIPTAPTATTSDNSQQIATTAFVKALTASLGSVTSLPSISVNAAGNTFSSTVANATTTPQLSLTIPLASASGTTAGLLSNSDYANFNAKQTALTAGVDYQIPLIAGTDYQIPLRPGIDIQTPLVLGVDYQSPLIAGIDYQVPLVAGTDFQIPLIAGTDYQVPLIAGTDYQVPLTPGIDYQVPLVSGTDYQAPLLAGTDYQTPLTAGSGIVLTGSSIAVSGLTTANMSAAAGITNGQLANSQLTLGSTIATLGGTYTNLLGFASITSSNFVGDLTGNASTATTALTANTATTLATPQTIFGYPFDGSASISGIISPTYGGTGVNNGNKSITLGGDLATSGNFSTTIITTGTTSISLPTSGTLATLAETETLTNKTLVNSSLTGTLTLGGTTFPSSSGVTDQVLSLTSSGVASWTSVLKDGFDETASNGSAGTMTTTTAGQTNFTLTQAPHSTSRLKMYINGILISQNAYAYKTSSSFATDATVPTSYLAYINAKNGTYLIAVGDRVQFVYTY